MSEKHRNYFNEKAPIWDQLMSHRDLQQIANIIKELGIQEGSTILDVGTGTGIVLPFLKEEVGPRGKIVAFDIAEEMLQLAREKNGDEIIEYIEGDLTATSFAEHTFDVILCYSCFPHMLDKEAVAREMMRILKPLGRTIICHSSSREELNHMHQSIGGAVGNDMLPDNETMNYIFQKAGFIEITITERDNEYVLTGIKP